MSQFKTPGVYIEERNSFQDMVVSVPTAVPAFLGYTEKAELDGKPRAGVPTRISSMADYEAIFGTAPRRVFTRTNVDGTDSFDCANQFYLYHSLHFYFVNGGGPCWIVSVGRFDTAKHTAAEFSDEIWQALAKIDEPSTYVVPDAVALSRADYKVVCDAAFAQCAALGDRVLLLDIYDGGVGSTIEEAIDGDAPGAEGFRNLIDFPDQTSFGIAYYPWLNTDIIQPASIDYTCLDQDSIATLATELGQGPNPLPEDLLAQMKDGTSSPDQVTALHRKLVEDCHPYAKIMDGFLAAMNVLPPAAAMAGIFARTDTDVGVMESPANVLVMSAHSPTVQISAQQQEGLNAPANGYAVNAIRTFEGRELLVWGARTLAGNAQDYRYINVRRTMIMLEQSIKFALQAYASSPNTAVTWREAKLQVENFLDSQWKAGALAGAAAGDAFDVNVGLGTTMTAVDVLEGAMRMSVRVAVTRPAEFIELQFHQQMQQSQ